MDKNDRGVLLGGVGVLLDGWQLGDLDKAWKNRDYYISAPRQVGKTQLAIAYMLEAALAGRRVLYLSHRMDTSRAVNDRVVAVCARMKPIVQRIRNSQGYFEVELKSGGCIMFRVRASGVSVGQTFDTIVWDEAQRINTAHVAEIQPVLSSVSDPKQLFIGTPPSELELSQYPSGPFLKAHERGGKTWREYSAYPVYREDLVVDLKAMRRANPSWRRISAFKETRDEALETLGHRSFCQQYLGVWLPSGGMRSHDYAMGADVLKGVLTKQGSSASSFECGIGMLPESDKAYVAFSDGVTAEVVHRADMSNGGIDGLVVWLRERSRSIKRINVPGNMRGKALAGALQDARLGAKVKVLTTPEHGNAIGRLLSQCTDGTCKVFAARDTELALSSWWAGYDTRSGSMTIKAELPTDAALVMSLAHCTVSGATASRVAGTRSGGRAVIW